MVLLWTDVLIDTGWHWDGPSIFLIFHTKNT
jgi:hypothetical protein